MSMSIDLTEPIAVGHHLADTVRRRAGDGVDAVRDVDLHLPVAAEAGHRSCDARSASRSQACETRRS